MCVEANVEMSLKLQDDGGERSSLWEVALLLTS